MTIKDEVSGFIGSPFNRALLILLAVIGIALLIQEYTAPAPPDYSGALIVHFFYSPTCPHCAAQEPFNEKLLSEYPGIVIVKHDVTIPSESRLLLIMAQNFSLGPESLGTPTTIFGSRIFVGFQSENITGAQMRDALDDCIENGCGGEPVSSVSSDFLTGGMDLPILGRTDISSMSLPVLAAVLGLVDGFNPCAMWVLVYLISLLMNFNDKRRLALIVGTFVLSSGVLYFLFMTAWLNAFLFLGYVRAVTILVGLVALGGGILSIREYFETKGAMVCKVTDLEGKKKISARVKELVTAPLSWMTFGGIVFLAFTINSIEFVCSSAIPAVFTQVLALNNLPTWQYYAYILLYDLFFMLDDLLIFGSALLIMSNTGEKYARYCKIIGGAVMLLLGAVLLFAPHLLA
ncbi:thioredoxin [Candidatus Micrarchaeota archaeon]|nr:thioredoxin [Candidatus Micrarchaeota archaeon]